MLLCIARFMLCTVIAINCLTFSNCLQKSKNALNNCSMHTAFFNIFYRLWERNVTEIINKIYALIIFFHKLWGWKGLVHLNQTWLTSESGIISIWSQRLLVISVYIKVGNCDHFVFKCLPISLLKYSNKPRWLWWSMYFL